MFGKLDKTAVLFVDRVLYRLNRVLDSEPTPDLMVRLGKVRFKVTLHPQAKQFFEKLPTLTLRKGKPLSIKLRTQENLTKSVLDLLEVPHNVLNEQHRIWNNILLCHTAPIYDDCLLRLYDDFFPHSRCGKRFAANVLAPEIQAKTVFGQALIRHYYQLPEFYPGKLPVGDLLTALDEIQAQARSLVWLDTRQLSCCPDLETM